MAIQVRQLESQTSAREALGFFAIPTAQLRPDGQAITLWVRHAKTGVRITDFGETCTFVKERAGSQRLPMRVKATVEGICRMNEVEFDRGEISLTLSAGEREQDALARIARVCARIAALKVA